MSCIFCQIEFKNIQNKQDAIDDHQWAMKKIEQKKIVEDTGLKPSDVRKYFARFNQVAEQILN